MQPTSLAFKETARRALDDAQLQRALLNMKPGFQQRRAGTVAKLPEFDALRDQARAIKNHTLANLDHYLTRFEAQVQAAGGHVHWAATAQEATDIVVALCRAAGARTVTKGKSMVAEEIALNDALQAAGFHPLETDLGEYIIQLRDECPSHIIAPALHLTRQQITRTFQEAHTHLPADRPLDEPRQLTDEARAVLRDGFLGADVGITGANFLVAETGSTVIVTNEGNGDLTQTLPKTHIVVSSIEKVVPTLEDTTTILRLLARSATGQEFSAYTTFSTGPRRADDPDGPEAFHVVLVDNGRAALLATEAAEALRCIRCGACMNHCPVYGAVGGHAYGWVVPGPIGAALDPGLIGVETARHLPNASTFCGRCESVCPMRIPLTTIMRHWRTQEHARKLSPGRIRWGLGVWAYVAARPRLYRLCTRLGVAAMAWVGRRRGHLRRWPGAEGWTRYRDLPAPQGGTFVDRWQRGERGAPARETGR